MQTSLARQSYDHRIREAICESRNPDFFPELDIPNSTIRSWLHRGSPDVIISELVGRDHKLLDGTRTFLHAIIDNYSRRILSWTLESCLGSRATCRVLRDVAKEIVGNKDRLLVVTDSGCENVNREVDEELDGSSLERVLAQNDVTYSNSMIEAFWRSMEYSWL